MDNPPSRLLINTCSVSTMAMSMVNTYSRLCRNNPTTSLVSQISLPKSLPIHLKAKRNSSALITNCFNSDAAKHPIKETPIELRYEAFPTVMDIQEISEIMPHRFPFLLVDRVVEYTPGGFTAVGIKNFTINEYFFPGHFPGKPIVPGVILIEAMAQVGGIVMQSASGRKYIYFVGIDKVRFKKQVIAGDTLVMRMTITRAHKHLGIVKLEGKAYVGGELVCEGEFSLYVSDKDSF